MKQNVSETESNQHFREKCKNMSTERLYLMLPSRHAHLHLILILPVTIFELLQQHTKYYSPLLVNPINKNCCKELCHVAESLGPSLKTSPWTKTSLVVCENQSFFLLFQDVATLIKIQCAFFVTFHSMPKYF